MTLSDIDRLEQLFSDAATMAPGERTSFLRLSCPNDNAMQQRVLQLLDARERSGDFLEPHDDTARLEETRPSSALHGQRVGRYTVRRIVASGGMGVVYEATQDTPHRTVALKAMRGGILSGTSAQRRFRHEVEILGRLQHPNIARIYEAGVHEDGPGPVLPFFAMEWIDGQPITTYARHNNLNTADRLQLMITVCHAIHYAHQKGVIHRDLKPTNILVTDPPTCGDRAGAALGGKPVVLDFGVARATRSDLKATTLLTDVGQIVGTMPYMSPEQMLGDPQEVDVRSDVYALGVLLHVLLCDRLPFEVENKTVPEIIRIVREEDLRPLTIDGHRQRGDLETISTMALARDPEKRYQSASDLAGDLERYLAGEPIVAHPPSTVYQLRRLFQKHRLPVAVGTIVAVVVVACAIGASMMAIQLNNQRDAEAQQRRLAERRFADVHSLATTLLFDVHDEIVELEGASAARELIVATGVKALDDLAVQNDDDINLQRDLANAYIRAANIEGNPHRTNMGRTSAAAQHCRHGLNIVNPLIDQFSNREDFLIVGAAGEQLMAALLDVTAPPPEAMQHYVRAIELREACARLGMDHLRQPRLDRIHHQWGLTLFRRGDLAGALQHHERAVDLLDRLREAHPDVKRLATEQAGTLVYVATCQLQLTGPDAVFAPTNQARHILEAAVAADENNLDTRRDLATAYSLLGQAHAHKREYVSAIRLLELALSEFRKQVEKDDADLSVHRNVTVMLHLLGEIRRMSGDLDGALTNLKDMLNETTWLTQRDPDTKLYQRDDAVAYSLVAVVLRQQNRLEESRDHFEGALSRFADLAADDTSSPGPRRDLSVSYFELAKLHKDLAQLALDDPIARHAHWKQALTRFKECLSIYHALGDDGHHAATDEAVITTLDNEIAECQTALESVPTSL